MAFDTAQPAAPKPDTYAIVSGAVKTTLSREDVPILQKDVPVATAQTTSAVLAAIRASGQALVPVESALASKINWTQTIMLVLTLLTAAGVPIDDATKLQIVSGVVAIGTVLTVVWKTFFSRSITPQSKG